MILRSKKIYTFSSSKSLNKSKSESQAIPKVRHFCILCQIELAIAVFYSILFLNFILRVLLFASTNIVDML